MNIKGLRAYKLIMDRGTLAAAAEEMNISESALSRQLALLESELGLTLFSRGKRRLVPTDEGEAFYREAEWLLDSIEQIPRIVNEIKQRPRRRVRIIVMPRMAESLIVLSIQKFMQEDPKIHVVVDVQSRRFLERGVVSRQFDFGVGALPAFHTAIETERLWTLPAAAVLNVSHPLAERASVRLEELIGTPFITLPSHTLMRQQVNRMFARANLEPDDRIITSHTRLACSFVARNVGFTIVDHDKSLPYSFGHRIRLVPIEPRFDLHFGVFFHKGTERDSSTNRLVELMRACAGRMSDIGSGEDVLL